MKSRRKQSFRSDMERLPLRVRAQAKTAYELFSRDPYHRSLHFKCVDEVEHIWSVRIGRGYRALGTRRAEQAGDAVVWFWIGPHAEYDQLLRRL